MFGFDKPEDGSEERFHERVHRWTAGRQRSALPWLQHYAWWIIHNLVAHPIIAVAPVKAAFAFHDWTSRKMNKEPAA